MLNYLSLYQDYIKKFIFLNKILLYLYKKKKKIFIYKK